MILLPGRRSHGFLPAGKTTNDKRTAKGCSLRRIEDRKEWSSVENWRPQLPVTRGLISVEAFSCCTLWRTSAPRTQKMTSSAMFVA